MIDLLRIHVLWAPRSEEGRRIAEMIARHFDGIGMEREGVAHRVPVRFVSEPWSDQSPDPRDVDLDSAAHNAVILLHDDEMHADGVAWDPYVQALRKRIEARGEADVYLPFGSPDGDPPLASDDGRRTHYARRDRWNRLPNDGARDKRLLLHILFAIRRHLAGSVFGTRSERLFVSHAKADGDDIARLIVDYVNDSGHDVPLETFYDAMELNPGEDYEQRFVNEIEAGTLLAIVSDVYDSRPWCVFELTTAKQKRRPIILADVGQVRISRTFPYGANLPRVRVRTTVGDASWIEPLLVETLSEGLRCDLFTEQATRATQGRPTPVLTLPRPPELFDIVERDDLPDLIVHPDPPLGDLETRILERALKSIAPATRICTLGELE